MTNNTVINSLSPTSSWQALDNGILFAKQHFSSVWKPLLIVLIILSILLVLLLPDDSLYWCILIIWWLKPLLDRFILSIYSECATGSAVNFRYSLRLLKRVVFGTSLWRDLTINRISMIRSFRLPVYQLEKQKGKDAKNRITVLSHNTSGRAVNLTFLAVHMEFLITLTIFTMVWFLIPQEFRSTFLDDGLSGDSYYYELITITLYCISVLIIEPLYVASGFILYLNKRVILEGWDIEIGFKNLYNRMTG